jgi:hypothetical protein
LAGGGDLLGHYQITLLLSQVGTDVSGTFNGFHVNGRAAGSSMHLSGDYALASEKCRPGFDNNTICELNLEISATRDTFDRLEGSVTYRMRVAGYSTPDYSVQASAQFVGVARWP